MTTPRTATIIKTFRFEAAHQLVGSGTECDHVHGHSYRFEVHLSGPVQTTGSSFGMVVNFADVSKVAKELIVGRLDHKFISATDSPEPFMTHSLRYVEKLGQRAIDNFLDGVALIDVPTTTAEEMSKWIGDTLIEAKLPVRLIRFWETETGCAEYSPGIHWVIPTYAGPHLPEAVPSPVLESA